MNWIHSRELDRELLGLLLTAGRSVRITDLFEGLSPRWAEAAAERLEIAGHIRELSGGKLELLPSGRALAGVVPS